MTDVDTHLGLHGPAQVTRINADEAAELLGVSKNTLYKYANEGAIPATRIRRNWIFIRQNLERWLAEQPKSDPADQ